MMAKNTEKSKYEVQVTYSKIYTYIKRLAVY